MTEPANKAPLVLIPPTTGPQSIRVSVQGDRLHVIINEVLATDMPWDKAIEFARALYAKAKQAESNHWAIIEKFQQVPVKNVLGMPVVTSKEHYERIGDLK